MRIFLLHIPFQFIYAVLMMFPSGLQAQPTILKTYKVNDGLPSTSTFSVYQDKYGYLWVGTTAGLSRFDGRQFVNYSISDGLPSLIVGRIFQDSKERLWV